MKVDRPWGDVESGGVEYRSGPGGAGRLDGDHPLAPDDEVDDGRFGVGAQQAAAPNDPRLILIKPAACADTFAQ
ncbi:hypothetical protein GCM10009681_06050 [Luedemannella helvata]|uniref:Uncharacterized protein n=1 Tax=Luedemannella helvata TaxID=349315 RepID=A0ABP4VXE7_9ACTN